MLAKIEELRDKLNNMRPFNQGELKRMLEEFTIRIVYNTNAIEGCTITLRETALIIQEGITIAERPLKEHLDIIGCKDAFQFVVELSENSRSLSEYDIKQIHSLVLMCDRENAGVYRRVPVGIIGSGHTPPQAYPVPKRIYPVFQLKLFLHLPKRTAALKLRPFANHLQTNSALLLQATTLKKSAFLSSPFA